VADPHRLAEADIFLGHVGNPLALIFVGAITAFIGKRVIEAVGLLILIYGVIRLVAPLIGVTCLFNLRPE
jgi:hypothetical protein